MEGRDWVGRSPKHTRLLRIPSSSSAFLYMCELVVSGCHYVSVTV